MKWITLSSFGLINPKSFTVPFVGGRDRSAGATKLPFWGEKKKKTQTNKNPHPLAKQLCRLLLIG